MKYQFIYDSKESKFCSVDCYYVYDTRDGKRVTDVYDNTTCIHIDRHKRIIYFYGMHTDYHWILEKQVFFNIINEFLELADAFGIIGYHIDEDCVGGKIYYKYN